MAWANYLKDTDTVEFIAGIDQGAGRAIFSSMAGALTSKNMQILAAETNMLADGLLLLRYVASEPESPGEPPAERLADDLPVRWSASIDSDEAPKFPKILGREQKEAGAALSNLPNEVRIDNEMSDECTVVEVFTIDRRGLLYRLARALHDLRAGDPLRQDRHVSRPGGGRVLRHRARRAKAGGRRAAGGDSRRSDEGDLAGRRVAGTLRVP